MILFKKATDLAKYLEAQRKDNKKIGFAPTMGALHAGHISLVEASKKQNEVTVSSIFVNPSQFNDPADFEKYPVTIDTDISMLELAGCDILFLPSVKEIYPSSYTKPYYDLGYLETILEGKYRPGHFQGVCMVVDRLLHMVHPDNLYLGQKDYQQCMVITRLIELLGMQDRITVNIAPTLREEDGLAMSSRNMRLNNEERKRAPAIFQSLLTLKSGIGIENMQQLKTDAVNFLTTRGLKADYVEIADAKTLEPVDKWDGSTPLVALIAAYNNDIRLIDNMALTTSQ